MRRTRGSHLGLRFRCLGHREPRYLGYNGCFSTSELTAWFKWDFGFCLGTPYEPLKVKEPPCFLDESNGEEWCRPAPCGLTPTTTRELQAIYGLGQVDPITCKLQ